jgi:DNA-3-methyladenine glycosylase
VIDLLADSEIVAPQLLGCTLACRGTAGVIVEVEAYHQDDPASHSFGGVPTKRTDVMFQAGGMLYVYFTYGMHWCANVVTGPAGSGQAVLFRAVTAVAGIETMHERRGGRPEIGNGPARLTQALDIRSTDNGRSLLASGADDLATALERSVDGPVLVRDVAAAASVGIELPLAEADVLIGPRIGITKAVERPWRFGVRGSGDLSKRF